MDFAAPLLPAVTRVLVAVPPAAVGTNDALLADLDFNERATVARLRVAADRDCQVTAHVLLRRLLSALATSHGAPVRPTDWRFGRSAFGKPYLLPGQWPGPLELNLSHTRGLVAVAVRAGAAVGVDVECNRRVLHDGAALARHCYTKAERQWLDWAGPPGSAGWTQRFFQLWTAKEACIKGLGQGLSRELQSFSVDLVAGRWCYEPGARPEPSWRLHQWQIHGQPLALAESAPWGGAPQLIIVDLTLQQQLCLPNADASTVGPDPR